MKVVHLDKDWWQKRRLPTQQSDKLVLIKPVKIFKDNELYSTQEIAQVLKKSPTVILRRLNDGSIRGFKEGIEWRVFGSVLNEYVERLMHGRD